MKINFIGRILLSVTSQCLMLANTGCGTDVAFQDSEPLSQRAKRGQIFNENFTQGYVERKLDILFVVDNSGSMAEEQAKMGDKINSFISTLHDVDWQIGVTTTDISDGTYGLKGDLLTIAGTQSHILTPSTPNYESAFKSTVVRTESINCTNCASGDEQPIRAAIMAIEKRDTTNKNFFRSGADLGLVVLSDEDEMSSGPPQATQPAELTSLVKSIWQDNKRIFTFGMIIEPGDTQCLSQQGGAGHYGTHVSLLATLTGGLTGSICDSDYAPTLGLIGENARRLLEYIQLSYYPIIDSVQIKMTPDFNTTWNVQGRRIYMIPPPPKDTLIQVSYVVE